MLQFAEYDNEINYRTFKHGKDIFQKALNWVIRGEKRFHIEKEDGSNYDLLYIENHQLSLQDKMFPMTPMFRVSDFYPTYLIYSINSVDMLCLSIFEQYDTVAFATLNEYSYVLCEILLKYTNKVIYFSDERICWFVEDERVIIGEVKDSPTVMHVTDEFRQEGLGHEYHEHMFDYIWSLTLFHNVFFLYSLTDLELNRIKYVEIAIEHSEGIGSMLTNFSRIKKVFENYGLQSYLKANSSRYDDKMLHNYFNLEKTPLDANEENTIYISHSFPLYFVYSILTQKVSFDDSLFSKQFKTELDEYAEAVLGSRKGKMLGVLVRGTDFISAKMSVAPLSIEELLPKLEERLKEYDGIFLVTEDRDYFDAIRKAFPKKVVSIAQKRYSVTDFKKSVLICELEKELYDDKLYISMVEDTTINYFYALYLLSKCDSLLSTPDCSALNIAKALNNGAYNKVEVLIKKNF